MMSIQKTPICPQASVWSDFYLGLKEIAERDSLPSPPVPLILAGWAYSTDNEKMARWKQTIKWLSAHQLDHLLERISDSDMYTANLSVSGLQRGWDDE